MNARVADPQPTPAALRQRRSREKRRIAREVEFVRADWGLFVHPDRLPQKAGCPRDRPAGDDPQGAGRQRARRGRRVALDQVDPDTWTVTDDGRGLDREQVVRLFAVNRPMLTTKLVRRPTSGAIGNGLRVVTGGAVASGGRLAVESRGVRYVLDVDRATGETLVVEEGRARSRPARG